MSSLLLVYTDSLTGPYHFTAPTKGVFARAFFEDHDGSGGGPGVALQPDEVREVVLAELRDLEMRIGTERDPGWAHYLQKHHVRPLRRLLRSLKVSQLVRLEWLI